MAEEVMVHCFEKAGLGKAPFRFVGVVELPSPSLAAQNPEAYNAALRMIPRGVGCGTCCYCGQAIMVNCIVKSADGKRFAVGSDCIAKVGGAGLKRELRKTPAFKAKAKSARERAATKVKAEWAEIWANPEKAAVLATFTRENFKKEIEPYPVYVKRVWEWCGAAGRRRYLKEVKMLLAHEEEKRKAVTNGA